MKTILIDIGVGLLIVAILTLLIFNYMRFLDWLYSPSTYRQEHMGNVLSLVFFIFLLLIASYEIGYFVLKYF